MMSDITAKVEHPNMVSKMRGAPTAYGLAHALFSKESWR